VGPYDWDCAAGSDECGSAESGGVSFWGKGDEEAWADILAELDVLVDVGKVLRDGCVSVVFSKMSFCAPSWKLYKSR